jgi:hypothetical protein
VSGPVGPGIRGWVAVGVLTVVAQVSLLCSPRCAGVWCTPKDLQEVAMLDDHDPYRHAGDDVQLVERFVQLFHRRPQGEELLLFRCAEARLHLRLPGRTRKRAVAFIVVA